MPTSHIKILQFLFYIICPMLSDLIFTFPIKPRFSQWQSPQRRKLPCIFPFCFSSKNSFISVNNNHTLAKLCQYPCCSLCPRKHICASILHLQRPLSFRCSAILPGRTFLLHKKRACTVIYPFSPNSSLTGSFPILSFYWINAIQLIAGSLKLSPVLIILFLSFPDLHS